MIQAIAFWFSKNVHHMRYCILCFPVQGQFSLLANRVSGHIPGGLWGSGRNKSVRERLVNIWFQELSDNLKAIKEFGEVTVINLKKCVTGKKISDVKIKTELLLIL